jgi:7-cyano-7-deazaguanine tRNA-ribosyltransferase
VSALRFELKARDGLARIGELHTRHGVISTPALLPVVNPNLRDITPSQLRDEFGFGAVITNSYIIRRGDELRERALNGGLHQLLAFDGPIMTDSGTFQQHVYGDVTATNAEIVRFQLDIGSDIVTPLDLFTEPDEPLAKAESDWAETIKRYREAFTIDDPKGALLACAVQGGSHLAVRRRAAEDLGSLPACVHPIGGVVPIMEGERYPLLTDVIATAKSALNPSRPVHLFGAGHPLVIPMAVLLGCDLFDSSSYAKYAKDGRMIYPEGTRSLKDLVENPCACPICHAHTPAELRALEPQARYMALLRHNLHVLSSEVRRVRQAIREESVWELAEERARANPHVFEALRRIALHADLLEEAEPLSRMRAVRYFDATSAIRPLVERSRQRVLDRSAPLGPRAVLVRPRGTPYTKRIPLGLSKERKRAHVPLVFETVWGPVPEHLDECFPFAQTVAPGALDAESASRVARATEAFVRFHPATQFVRYDDAKLPQIQKEFQTPPPSAAQEDVARVRAILRYQFGPEASAVLEGGALVVERSRRTGKIRRVLIGGVHAFSMRAHDGQFSLTFKGGALLHKVLPAPRHRAAVEPETATFNAEGRSVFSKFVVSMDGALRPGDEVLVVVGTNLVAVGQVLLTAREAAAFKHGVAIQVREGQRSSRAEALEVE